ncbi:MFS transporter [Salinicoccus roseus]|uniref:MFS transporter n=1 Tax=Salinicoccus roseus TaxID=45670 RepID=A0A0C2E4Q8_9STAP|nr:MFS transporter [Salinicoccus roseus]KIH70307.1 multidrug MFS transporter [Salinicoccus roseus]MDB0580844.1 MFS transporter [Salinicoccus roseus]
MQNKDYSNDGIWTKEFVVIFMYHFIIMFAMYISIVTIGSFAIDNYNASASTAGLVASIFIVGVLAGRALTGQQINRLGARRLLYIGTAMFFVTYCLYFIEGGLSLLIITRFLTGFATGLISTALNTLATISVPENRRGEGISYFSLSFVLGSAVGPFLGFLLLGLMSYRMMLLLVGGLVLIVAMTIPMIRTNNIKRPMKPTVKGFKMVDRDALPMGFSILFMGLAYAGVLSFLNMYAQEVDLVTAASFFFIVYAISITLTRPFTGKLMDQKGANIVLYPAFILMAIGFFMLGSATTGLVLLASSVLIGFGYGNFQSIAQTVCVNLASRENVGLATSTYFIMLEIGLGFGPFFLGFLVPSLGYGGLYQFLVISVLIAMGIFHFVYGRHESAEKRMSQQGLK